MKDLRGEIPAEEAPRGAVEAEEDVMLVATNDFDGGQGLGAVGEDSPVLDQGLVRKEGVGNIDAWLRTDMDIEDWTIFGMKVSKTGLRVSKVLMEQCEAANDGKSGRPGRKSDKAVYSFENERETKEEDDDEAAGLHEGKQSTGGFCVGRWLKRMSGIQLKCNSMCAL